MNIQESLEKARDLAEVEPDDALRICNEVLNEDPENSVALFFIGYICLKAERYGMAYNILRRCAEVEPDRSQIWNNMGQCIDMWNPDLAISYYRKALECDPKNFLSIINHACVYLKSAKPHECVKLLDRALKMSPDSPAALYNKGLANLFLRNWKEGWEGYAHGLGEKNRIKRDYGVPDWDGVSPGTVVIYGEQGTGDEVMFLSCLPDLLKTNKAVIDTQERFTTLFARSFGIPTYGDRFKNSSTLIDVEKIDFQCPMGSLPGYYRNSEDDFPGTPYLIPDPERCVQYKALLDTFRGKKIGISWSGGLFGTGKYKRTFSPTDFEPFFGDDVTLVSLEYKKPDIDGLPIKHWDRATLQGVPFDETIALISQLDLVITACSTVVYLAGAIGVPCYVLVPSEPGYRYHLTGGFPWYNSVKLVRQKGGESFKRMITRVRHMSAVKAIAA